MPKLFRDYGLSIVLAALFISSWLLQTAGGWVEFVAEQEAHGETPQLFGDSGYVWAWMKATFENWQSEFLQLFTFVVLTTFLVHRGSPESRDGDEELKLMIQRLEQRLRRIEPKEAR
jgi:hypothetical protein